MAAEPCRTAAEHPSAPSQRLRRHLTASGACALLLACITAAAALHTGNNRLQLVLGAMLAAWLVELVLGPWNLRNLRPSRRLPDELHAGQRASGSLVLENPRRMLPAVAVRLVDRGDGATSVAVAWLSSGTALQLSASWHFPRRGRARQRALLLTSRFPFGLLEHRLELDRPADLLVYPASGGMPRRELVRTLGSHLADDDLLADPRRGGAGDFLDLRPYQAGDPLRLVHWPTSARLGQPMVVVRGTDTDEQVLVELNEVPSSERWERAIREACGQVLHHCRLGRAVGLQLGRRRWPPRTGASQRRSLLRTLALLPRRQASGKGA